MPAGIKKIVAFACSSMANLSSTGSRSSACQHALVLQLRDFLTAREGGQNGIKCYAQDPVYQDSDKSILEKLGITVLADPRGFLEVDETSVVLSISPNIPIRQIITDIARPALMIWNRVTDAEPRMLTLVFPPSTAHITEVMARG